MADLTRLLAVIRQRWWYILIPAIVLAGSAVAQQYTQPQRVAVAIDVSLTSNAPMNDTGDTLAYDFPAISRGNDYRQRVVALISPPITTDTLATMLDVRNNDRVVTIRVSGADSSQLVAIRDAALAVLVRDGTLLWGKTGSDTAVNVMVLHKNDTPQPQSIYATVVATMLLRGLAGALLGLLVAARRIR
jgi:hypothetical protein